MAASTICAASLYIGISYQTFVFQRSSAHRLYHDHEGEQGSTDHSPALRLGVLLSRIEWKSEADRWVAPQLSTPHQQARHHDRSPSTVHMHVRILSGVRTYLGSK